MKKTRGRARAAAGDARARGRGAGPSRAWLEHYPEPLSAAVTRSMKGNRRVDTRPEVRVRALLHRAGLRFRKDYLIRFYGGRAKADICFTRWRIAVFIDGCFWHCCPHHATTPKRNSWYWRPKLRRNRERDQRATGALRRAGWLVRRFWEHVSPATVASRIRRAIRPTGG